MYEKEDMGDNMANLIEHVKSMNSAEMPRDYFAQITHNFIPGDDGYSTFQKLHMESCMELAEMFPDVSKRKINGNALPLTMFKINSKEVEVSQNVVAKQMFVEAFKDKEQFLNNLVFELEDCLRLEEKMSSGARMVTPEFLADEDDDKNVNENVINVSKEFEVNDFVKTTCQLLEGKTSLEISRLVKIFLVGGKTLLGIYHPGVKKEAENQGLPIVKIPPPKKYPAHVKSGIQIFSKLDSTSMNGKANTVTRVCIMTELKHLKEEARMTVCNLLNFDSMIVTGGDEPVPTKGENIDFLLHEK